MKKAVGWTILIGATLAFGLASGAEAKSDQVDICHFPPGQPANVQVIQVGEKAAVTHVEKHGDFPVVAFNVNEVGCAFCAEASDDCQIGCVSTPPCICGPDDLEACCEENPCCDPCPEPKPEECDLIFCGSDPPQCSVTVCPKGDEE